MTEETHPIVDLTNADLDAMLKRALRITLILGSLASLLVLIGGGWRSGAMLLTGTLISAASILEWQRLVRVINARMDKQKTPASAGVVVLFFVLRLTIFAWVIYVSLKCFHGSVTALLCGLCLAVLAIGWEAIRLLRD
ncbi:MAG TPA: ATP synthase subunit I [Terracidiphilus sp.]|jgi:ATP synthase I chain|nr:ATP synthase subunit I [Terracidiphilus sp.]HUX28273.1 ATP synthase subunit I [Terracidiphilus sp.]